MKTLSTDGIILRRIDYGEADRIITFLTKDYGKIRVMAKGVRRQKSKMAGGIELFSVSELHFIKGKGEIDTLVSTRLKLHFGGIVKDLDRTELAYSSLKTIDKIIEDRTGEEYFDILLDTLAALDNQKIPLGLTEVSFLARTLSVQGHIPDFTTDSSGNKLDPGQTYSYDFESVCFRQDPKGQFNKNHLKVLKLLAHNSPQSVAAVRGIGAYLPQMAAVFRPLATHAQN